MYGYQLDSVGNSPFQFRLESVGKEVVGIRRNRQESTKNASDSTQLLTDPAIGMLDLGQKFLRISLQVEIFHDLRA